MTKRRASLGGQTPIAGCVPTDRRVRVKYTQGKAQLTDSWLAGYRDYALAQWVSNVDRVG